MHRNGTQNQFFANETEEEKERKKNEKTNDNLPVLFGNAGAFGCVPVYGEKRKTFFRFSCSRIRVRQCV